MTLELLRAVPPLVLALVAASSVHAQVAPYRAIDLGPVPGQSPQAGVTGKVLHGSGDFACGTSVWEPFVWRRSGGMLALSKLPGYLNGEAFDVDGNGRAVGSCGLLTTGSTPIVAVVWDALGNPTSLGNLGGTWSRALGISASGLVVGAADVGTGTQRRTHVFTWTSAAGMVDFTPSAQTASFYDVNDRDQMLLYIDGATLRYTPGQGMLPLGGFVGERLNELGQIAGRNLTTNVAARYTDGTGWDTIGAGWPYQISIGGINSFGQIAGTHSIRIHNSPPSYARYGQLYTDGLGLVRLDDWVDPTQQVRVYWAEDLNDDGLILASGSMGPNNRALLLEPRFVHPYGSACAGGAGRRPKLAACGVPFAGSRMALLAAGGVPSGMALLLLSPMTASVPLPGGCTLAVDLQQAAIVPLPLNTVGQGSLTVTIPGGVRRVNLHAQLATIDPGAANGVFAMSRGVTIELQ